jgi:hypothetical protein
MWQFNAINSMIKARIGTTFFCQLAARHSERKTHVLQDMDVVREEILFGTEKATDSELEYDSLMNHPSARADRASIVNISRGA